MILFFTPLYSLCLNLYNNISHDYIILKKYMFKVLNSMFHVCETNVST